MCAGIETRGKPQRPRLTPPTYILFLKSTDCCPIKFEQWGPLYLWLHDISTRCTASRVHGCWSPYFVVSSMDSRVNLIFFLVVVLFRQLYIDHSFTCLRLIEKKGAFKVLMKRKLSLSYFKEHLKWQSNIFCSFWFPCFVFEIFQFVWYAN